jgi:hypothetical protein
MNQSDKKEHQLINVMKVLKKEKSLAIGKAI